MGFSVAHQQRKPLRLAELRIFSVLAHRVRIYIIGKKA
jgi:hypothetical protein